MTTTQTRTRLDFARNAPQVFKALIALDAAARKDLDPVLVELVLTRASQVNNCAYCLDMHTRDARKAGESEQRLYLLSAWHEATGVYTEKERAALALTESVTALSNGPVPDDVYWAAAEHFTEAELAQLIGLIFTINAWNRIAVTTQKVPGTP